MRKLTNKEYIDRCIEIHGNLFSYEKTNYKNSRTKVIVTDKNGRDIEVLPLDFLKKFKNKNIKYNTKNFINKSKEIFGEETYSYEKTICNSSNDYVTITCKKHGDFIKRAYVHIDSKQGCPKCSKIVNSTEEFILKARQVHGWKYDYSKTNYINNNTKIIVICPKHGEFSVLPLEHLKGVNCRNCANENRRKPLNDFIKDSNLEKRGISLIGDYCSMFKKTLFKCNNCGKEWFALPNKIQNGRGCPFCNKGIASTEEFIKKAKKIHGESFDYSKVEYKNSLTPVTVTCKKHGDFEIIPTKFFVLTNPCKKCSNKSKMEHDIIMKLDEIGISYINNKSFSGLKNKSYDFFIKDFNILIECQGEQHFCENEFFGGTEQFLKQNENDLAKKEFANKNGIRLIYFTYLKNYDTFLGEKLIKSVDSLVDEILK